MTLYGNLNFFIFLIFSLIPAIVMGLKEKKIKNYGMILTIIYILLITQKNMVELLYILLFAFAQTYLVQMYLILRKKFGKKRIIYLHAVGLSILPLVIYKISNKFNSSILGFVGISYVTFKTVQVIIEIYDGIIEKIKIIDFLQFLFFFPTLSAGPIDRSRRFIENLNTIPTKKEYVSLLGEGIWKIMLGIAYKFILSPISNYYLLKLVGSYSPKYLIPYAFLYGFYMFFDFAGYSLMAIGTSYILGIKTPDNFNKPFISIDIKDFWNRWHITLSHWLRDFVFTRFMIDSIKNKRFNNKNTMAFWGFMTNMVLMGIWHGLSWNYILYGIYHGLLLGITEIYQKKSTFYKKHKNNRLYKFVSWFITINLVMVGFLIFSGYIENVIKRYMIVIFG